MTPLSSSSCQSALDRLGELLGDGLVEHHLEGDTTDLWVRVTPEAWTDAARAARDDLGCTFFDFLSAIDWMASPYGRDMDAQEDVVSGTAAEAEAAGETEPYEPVAGSTSRFQLLAHVINPEEHFGVILKCDLADPAGDTAPTVDTWSDLYAGANWHEREAAEMFGIDFVGHPNLINLYLPGEFEGHPLRKDFPLLSRRVRPWPGIVDVEPLPASLDPDANDGDGQADAAEEGA